MVGKVLDLVEECVCGEVGKRVVDAEENRGDVQVAEVTGKLSETQLEIVEIDHAEFPNDVFYGRNRGLGGDVEGRL